MPDKEFEVARVDAPDYILERARVALRGNELRLMNQACTVLGTFTFDAPPFVSDEVIRGLVDGRPMMAFASTECGCLGTRRIMKAQPA